MGTNALTDTVPRRHSTQAPSAEANVVKASRQQSMATTMDGLRAIIGLLLDQSTS